MSRIGKKPIEILEDVQVAVNGNTVTVKGPKGELRETLSETIEVSVEDSQVVVSPRSDDKDAKILWGLSRSLIKNMIDGVSKGFKKELELIGIGYRAKIMEDNKLVLNIGYTVPVKIQAPEGITFEVIDNTKVLVTGVNKSLVGQVAAHIRSQRPPEPYKGKGIKYVGEVVRKKAGKAAKVGGS